MGRRRANFELRNQQDGGPVPILKLVEEPQTYLEVTEGLRRRRIQSGLDISPSVSSSLGLPMAPASYLPEIRLMLRKMAQKVSIHSEFAHSVLLSRLTI